MIVLIFSVTMLLYLISAIFPAAGIVHAVSILSLLCIIVSYRSVRGVIQVLGGIMLAAGLIIMLRYHTAASEILFSFGYMINVLTLFALVPLMAIPMQIGRYGEDIQKIVSRKVKSSSGLYMLTAGVTHILAVFTYLASLPMMYYAIRPSADVYPIQDQDRFMSRAIVQGFSMTTMWTPIAPILATVIAMTGVTWSSIVVYVLTLSMLGLALVMVMGYWIEKKSVHAVSSIANLKTIAATAATVTTLATATSTPTSATVTTKASDLQLDSEDAPLLYRKVWHVLIAIVILSILTFVLESLLPFNFLFIIMILIIPFGLVWSLAIGKLKEFWDAAKVHPAQYLPKMKDQFVIFLSAGFFITALHTTGADIVLNGYISDFKDLIGVNVFIVIIPLFPLGLAFIGMHPAVALALIAQSIDPELLGISPQLLSVSMLAGAATSFLMGPYNATIGVMSGIVKRSTYQVSNWNLPYTIAFLILSMVYLVVLQFIL